MRPQSRGMPGPVPATLRPVSGMGQGMQGMRPMGGGMGSMPPGTAQRMGTGRQGTAARKGTAAQPFLGVGAQTQVQVTERPMTTAGLGLKTGSLGPGRQVYDRTYYMLELRKRMGGLQEEIMKLNKEINEISQDGEVYQSLDKRYETLVKTVRALEGDLADHNLSTDKLRTDTQPEEVQHMYLLMKQQNEQERNDVDQVFLEKRSHEEEIQRMSNEMQAMTKAAEERLNELHPDQRQEYGDLRDENVYLGRELADGREELEHVSGRCNALEDSLQRDVLRAHAQTLQVVHQEAREKLDVLEQEMRQGSMSVPEQREILLSRVKTDNAEIVAAEKRNSELKLEKERLRTQTKDVISDAQDRKDEGNDQQKYEILFAKDQEMTQFIDSFAEHKTDEETKMNEKQKSVVRLLENISTALSLNTGLTPDGQMRDMEDELEFKSRQLQNSETTQNRLEAELTKRQGELDKIESLDMKITQELQQVETKMQQYEQDIEQKYDRVGEMQSEGSSKNMRLGERKQFLETRLSSLRQQVGFLRLRHESRRQQLADDESAAAIEAQEQKIRQFGQTLFTLKSFIKQKQGESDYILEMGVCMNTASEINKILQERRPAAMGA